MVFVFLCLILLSLIISRSIHSVVKAKSSLNRTPLAAMIALIPAGRDRDRKTREDAAQVRQQQLEASSLAGGAGGGREGGKEGEAIESK